MHTLDTVLFMPELCKDDAGTTGLTTAIYGDEVLINYYNPNVHGDTLAFKVVNLINKEVTHYSCYVRSLSRSMSHSSRVNSITFNSRYIAFLTYNSIYYFNRTNRNVNQYEMLKNEKNDQYEEIKFVGEDKLLLYRAYNYYWPNVRDYAKVKLCLYDIGHKSMTKCITPHMTNIAVSHMSPVHWIDACNGKILLGQNAYYTFDTYDDKLNFISATDNKISNWNAIDSTQLNKLNRLAGSDPSAVISYLQPKFLFGNSLCDGYFLIDANTLLVRYTLGYNHPDSVCRIFDIWKYNQNQWVKQDTSYELQPLKYLGKTFDPVVMEKNGGNYNFWFGVTQFTPEYTLIFRKASDTYPAGLTNKEYREREQKFALNNDLIMNMIILKRKY